MVPDGELGVYGPLIQRGRQLGATDSSASVREFPHRAMRKVKGDGKCEPFT
jgi:hypothetical protein